MKQFTTGTTKIVNSHMGDFNCNDWLEKLKAAGGYSEYLNKLGGVFSKWNGKTARVKTVIEFREIAEYVFGLFTIYGFDYNNGKLYRKWAGGKPFYVGDKKGRSNWGRIDDLCSSTKKAKTTNCNYGMDSLLYKAGLFGRSGQPTNSCGFKSHIKKRKSPFFRHLKDLQVGDLVQFFGDPVKTDNCDDWTHWHHVAVVGEIINGKVILYDSGGRFITSGNYKHELKVDANNKPLGKYSNYKGWVALRDITLEGAKDDLVKGRSDEAVAVEAIHGDFGTDKERKYFLGSRYDNVQKLVTYYVSKEGHNDYINACADFVLSGYVGTGLYRESYFGGEYKEVQAKINWVIDIADGIWTKRYNYGNDEERRVALGKNYQVVQNQINRTKDYYLL